MQTLKCRNISPAEISSDPLLAGHTPPLGLAGMVTQDEFSHDILVAYPGGLWLVYDST